MLQFQPDVGADEPPQQGGQVVQRIADIDDLGPQGLAAREGQQLPDQIGRPIGVLLDLHDIGEGIILRPVAGQQQVAETDDGGQQIVEIMGDAAGQLPHRLHLLRLDELLLQRLLGTDVQHIDDAGGAFFAQMHPAGPGGKEAQSQCGRGLEPKLGAGAIAAGEDLGKIRPSAVVIRRPVDQFEQILAENIFLFGLAGDQFGKDRIGFLHPAFGSEGGDTDRGIVDETAEAFGRFRQSLDRTDDFPQVDDKAAPGGRARTAALQYHFDRETLLVEGLQLGTVTVVADVGMGGRAEDLVDGQAGWLEVLQPAAQPIGQGGIHRRDRAARVHLEPAEVGMFENPRVDAGRIHDIADSQQEIMRQRADIAPCHLDIGAGQGQGKAAILPAFRRIDPGNRHGIERQAHGGPGNVVADDDALGPDHRPGDRRQFHRRADFIDHGFDRLPAAARGQGIADRNRGHRNGHGDHAGDGIENVAGRNADTDQRPARPRQRAAQERQIGAPGPGLCGELIEMAVRHPY